MSNPHIMLFFIIIFSSKRPLQKQREIEIEIEFIYVFTLLNIFTVRRWWPAFFSVFPFGHVGNQQRSHTDSRSFLGGGFKYLLFHPYLRKIPILTIFQRGWNHQLVFVNVVWNKLGTKNYEPKPNRCNDSMILVTIYHTISSIYNIYIYYIYIP